jgi:hypothetical protein
MQGMLKKSSAQIDSSDPYFRPKSIIMTATGLQTHGLTEASVPLSFALASKPLTFL